MAPHNDTQLPTSFVWRINAPHGVFTGEQKAQLVERMEEIIQRVSHGNALVEFSYDTASVIAKISAKTNAIMKDRAKEQAEKTTQRGFTGFVTRLLLFWYGAGQNAKAQLIERMEMDFLHKEQAKATAQLLTSFQKVMSYSNRIATEQVFSDTHSLNLPRHE